MSRPGTGTPRSLAVFRALNLGDMLCSMPALRALRAAFPEAHIALIGLPSARPVVERNRDCIDELILFPGDPAFPEQEYRPEAQDEFHEAVAARQFDLILQMHGSGLNSNRVVQAMPARAWAGFVPDASMAEPRRLMPWPDHLPETQRYLALVDWLGIPVDMAARPTLHLTDADQAEAAAVFRAHGLDPSRLILVHPGARLPSRRWPVERYAAVAATLAGARWQVAITGEPTESALVGRMAALAGREVVDLCGATSLGGLAALLHSARLLICNDTGVSHVAAAVAARSVVIASGSDVHRWAPGDASRHTVLHWQTPCRPCMYQECPYCHPCARGVTVEQVLAQARRALMEEEYERAPA